MKKAINILVTVLLFTQPLAACVNSSYSRLDEVQITDELLPLILGAFPHHGRAFYEYEIVRTQKILKDAPTDFQARNDLGVAYIKLEKWELAQAEFSENEKLHPGRYETASNRGVMFKKMGDYLLAEMFISESLKIKPGGHMGLGDYYLKMIQWLGERPLLNKFEQPNSTTNFLGIRYDAGPKATALTANEKHVITLIKNDYTFADAYFVLGDILFTRGDYQLALRAYTRSQLVPLHISHDLVRERLLAIDKVWREQRSFFQIVAIWEGRSQAMNEIGEAQMWLWEFQKIEEEFMSLNQPSTFQDILTEMDVRGINRKKVIEAGNYRGSTFDWSQIVLFIALGLLIAGLLVGLRSLWRILK